MLPQNSILSLRAQLDAIVDSLCKSLFTGTFKARWNTSHCFKMFLSNSNFPIGGSTSYTQKIFDALQRATVESLNFKVRTSAIHALSTPTLISKYQTLKSDGQTTIKNCIESCVKSIETVDIALERSSHDERLYLDQFFAAIRGAIIHFKEIFLTIGNDWNVEYIKLEQRAKELESLVKNPPVTTIKND